MNTQISLTPYDILTQWKYCGKIPDIIYYKGKQYDNCHKFFYEWFKDWKDVVKFVNMDLCEIDYPILSDHEKRIIHEDIRYAREQGYEPYALLKRIYLQQDNTYTYVSDLVYMEKPNSNFNFVDSNLRPMDMDSLIPNVTYNLQGLLAAQPSDEEIAKIRSMYNPWILSIKRITSGGQNELVFYDQDDNYYSSTILKPNELMTLKVNRPYFYDDFMR